MNKVNLFDRSIKLAKISFFFVLFWAFQANAEVYLDANGTCPAPDFAGAEPCGLAKATPKDVSLSGNVSVDNRSIPVGTIISNQFPNFVQFIARNSSVGFLGVGYGYVYLAASIGPVSQNSNGPLEACIKYNDGQYTEKLSCSNLNTLYFSGTMTFTVTGSTLSLFLNGSLVAKYANSPITTAGATGYYNYNYFGSLTRFSVMLPSSPTPSSPGPVALGTIYGPAMSDGILSAFARLDGVGGSGQLAVVADSSPAPNTTLGYGYMYNNGVTYPGSAQVTVPIRKGEYYQIQCNVPSGGICGNYIGYLTPVGASQSVFSPMVNQSQAIVYGPATSDGILSAFARLDGVGGSGQLAVVADSSPAPNTTLGYGYMYNNGVTYPGSAQVTVPIRKGEYYQIQCNVPGGGICSKYIGHFTPAK